MFVEIILKPYLGRFVWSREFQHRHVWFYFFQLRYSHAIIIIAKLRYALLKESEIRMFEFSVDTLMQP